MRSNSIQHAFKAWKRGEANKSMPFSKEELELIQPAKSSDANPTASSKRTNDNAVGSMQRPKIFRGGMTTEGIKRFGQKGAIFIYLDDLYHTLLNMPRYRFLGSFFVSYLLLYLLFAFVYLAMPPECICSEECGVVTFSDAFWFSVQTASTIGYSTILVPSLDCDGINFLVTFHLMVAALVDTMLMSLVFARFAAPMPRASTVRFSVHALVSQHSRPNPALPQPSITGQPSVAAARTGTAMDGSRLNGGTDVFGSSSAAGVVEGNDSTKNCTFVNASNSLSGFSLQPPPQQSQQGLGGPPLFAGAPLQPLAAISRDPGTHSANKGGLSAAHGSASNMNASRSGGLQGAWDNEIRPEETDGCLGGLGTDFGAHPSNGHGNGPRGHVHLEGVAGSPREAEVSLEGDNWMMESDSGLRGGGFKLRGGAGSSTSYWGISFRVANIRKHSLLHPELTLLLTLPDLAAGNATYRFVDLEIDDLTTQETNLRLGLPAVVTHIIDPKSPLFDLSLADMETYEMEILCFMSGTDPMTSNTLQARHVYGPSEMRINEQFNPISIRSAGGKVALDMSAFDDTNPSRTQSNFSSLPDSIFSPMAQQLQQQPMLMADFKGYRFRDLTSALVQEQVQQEQQRVQAPSMQQQQLETVQERRQLTTDTEKQQQQQQQQDAGWSLGPQGPNILSVPSQVHTGLASHLQLQLQQLCAALLVDAGAGLEVKAQAAALLSAASAPNGPS